MANIYRYLLSFQICQWKIKTDSIQRIEKIIPLIPNLHASRYLNTIIP